MLIRAYVDIEDDHWVAIAADYTITGVGANRDEAIDRMLELLDEYLDICAEEGIGPAEARRPLPATWELKIVLRVIAAALVDRVRRRARRTREMRIFVPHHLHAERHAC